MPATTITANQSTSTAAVQAAKYNYRVICEDGAYVRAGLELSSRHLYTISSQSIVEVTERLINNQGLARLKTADGWISEMLNPLSGQVCSLSVYVVVHFSLSPHLCYIRCSTHTVWSATFLVPSFAPLFPYIRNHALTSYLHLYVHTEGANSRASTPGAALEASYHLWRRGLGP